MAMWGTHVNFRGVHIHENIRYHSILHYTCILLIMLILSARFKLTSKEITIESCRMSRGNGGSLSFLKACFLHGWVLTKQVMIYKFRISFSKGQKNQVSTFFSFSGEKWIHSGGLHHTKPSNQPCKAGQVEELPILIFLADTFFHPNQQAPLTLKLSFLGIHSHQPTTLSKRNIIFSIFHFGSAMLLWEEGSFMNIFRSKKNQDIKKKLSTEWWPSSCFFLVFNPYIQRSSKITIPKSVPAPVS